MEASRPFSGSAANTLSAKRYSEMSKCAAWSAIVGCGGDGSGEAPSAPDKLDAGLDDVVELKADCSWPWDKYDDIEEEEEEEKKQDASPAACW
jgi:hypothetical protein